MRIASQRGELEDARLKTIFSRVLMLVRIEFRVNLMLVRIEFRV